MIRTIMMMITILITTIKVTTIMVIIMIIVTMIIIIMIIMIMIVILIIMIIIMIKMDGNLCSIRRPNNMCGQVDPAILNLITFIATKNIEN